MRQDGQPFSPHPLTDSLATPFKEPTNRKPDPVHPRLPAPRYQATGLAHSKGIADAWIG